MSSSGPKRRCIINKLDFENCIVTNIKTTSRGRKKLRARVTREFEDYSDASQTVAACGEPSDTSQQTDPQVDTSPVLTRKIRDGRGSPVFSKKPKYKKEKPTETGPVDVPSPSSPVFKFNKKLKISNASQNRCEDSKEILTNPNSISFNEGESSLALETSYQIDDVTTQESKESVKISSVESTSIKNRSSSTISAVSSTFTSRNTSAELRTSSFVGEKCDSPKRRNYRKNSLLGRLHKLQKKQVSEKMLWQHQNRRNSSSSMKFSVVSFWKDEFNFFLKCRSLPNDLNTFIVADSRWVPHLKTVKENSVLLIHPPWQKLTVEEFDTTVLINVICLDVLEEKGKFVEEKKTMEVIPAEEFETQETLFIESLFCTGAHGFLF